MIPNSLRWTHQSPPVRQLVATVMLALVGGCYLYRAPRNQQPVIAAAALTREAAIADLDTLVAIVREVHPDPGPQLRPMRDSLARAWPASVSRAQVWRDLSRVLATMNDGHTNLWLANDEIDAAVAAGARAFPLGVTRADGGVVISSALGVDTSQTRAGDRLLRINDAPIDDVVRELGRAVPSELDAYRDRVVLSNFGARLWLEGIRVPMTVTIARGDSAPRTLTLQGATLADFQNRRVSVARQALTARRTRDSLLVLDFTSMAGDLTALRMRLDSVFDAARTEGVRAVVVDLRRNGGGNSQQGIILLSYVTGKPLQQGLRKEWRSSLRYRSHMKSGVSPLLRWIPASWFDGSIGEFFSIPAGSIAVTRMDAPFKPPENPRRLERPLCVLIGPNTFSSAMMLANTVQQSGVGTLIGEPTGEPPNSHGEVLAFRLKQSGLAGQVSSARFVLHPDSAAAKRGVLPQVAVARTTADVVAGRDPVMERAMACGRQVP